MKWSKQQEIRQIFEEAGQSPNALEELNRLTRLQQIYMDEITDKLSTIWVVASKVDKVYKEIMEEKYGK